jgi:hypothetical protein
MLLGGPQNTIKSHLVFTALFCFAPFSIFFSRMSAPHCFSIIDTKISFICTQDTVLSTTLAVHKPVLTTVKCAVVRLRALMARHSARLKSNRPINNLPLFQMARKRTAPPKSRASFNLRKRVLVAPFPRYPTWSRGRTAAAKPSPSTLTLSTWATAICRSRCLE